MPIVDIKGVGKAQFPDGMSAGDIRAFLQRKYAQQAVNGQSDILAPQPDTVAPYNPSLVDKIGGGIANTLTKSGLISDNYRAQQIGKNLSSIGEFLPGVGDASAGDEFGRAVAKGDKLGVGLSALGVIPVAGDLAKKAFKTTKGFDVSDVADVDFDFPITHGSSDSTFDGTIKNKGVFEKFDGLFASQGDASEFGGKNQITFFPRKGKVAGGGDVDLDFDDAINTLKKEFPGADDDTLESIYDITAGDEDVFDKSINPLEEFGFDDLGEASWEAQNARGKIAADQGFDAISMSDEFGESFFIPKGSKAVISKQ